MKKNKALLTMLWNMKIRVREIVIGALGIVPKTLRSRLDKLKLRGGVGALQFSALSEFMKILRKVLQICCHLIPIDNHHMSFV